MPYKTWDNYYNTLIKSHNLSFKDVTKLVDILINSKVELKSRDEKVLYKAKLKALENILIRVISGKARRKEEKKL